MRGEEKKKETTNKDAKDSRIIAIQLNFYHFPQIYQNRKSVFKLIKDNVSSLFSWRFYSLEGAYFLTGIANFLMNSLIISSYRTRIVHRINPWAAEHKNLPPSFVVMISIFGTHGCRTVYAKVSLVMSQHRFFFSSFFFLFSLPIVLLEESPYKNILSLLLSSYFFQDCVKFQDMCLNFISEIVHIILKIL